MKLLLSPHNDDEALFAGVLCQREKPHVVICTDSYIQPARGEPGTDVVSRWQESLRATAILKCSIERLGIPDDSADEDKFVEAFRRLSDRQEWDTVYAPAIQGGNKDHDAVGAAALKVFSHGVLPYATYTKTELYTEGTIEIKPTIEELRIKKQALDQYESQIRINLPHFQAMVGKSEWLFGGGKLHLGCGRDIREGWVNLDRHQYPGVDSVCDATQGLPFSDNSFDEVYSQDWLEHLPPESKVFVINEIHRVLRHNGMMEHFVPNAGSRNDFGSPSHLSHWNLQQFEHWDIESYRYEKDKEFEGIDGGFRRVIAELVNWQIEDDGIRRAQSLHVKYKAVKH